MYASNSKRGRWEEKGGGYEARKGLLDHWDWSPSHWGHFMSAWVERLEMHLAQPWVMTQIRWDRWTDGQTEARSYETCCRKLMATDPLPPPTTHTLSSTGSVSKEPFATVFRSLTSLPNKAHKTSAADAAPPMVLHVFTAIGTHLHACYFLDTHCVFVLVHASCVHVYVLQTPCTLHEILKREDGDVCVLRLAGDVPWSSAGLCTVVMVVWPTHSLLPCSPPYTRPPTHQHPPCFPTEKMTFMHETISPLDCREYSLVVPRGPKSFALLLFNNSDFIGFHSWVDTDVLVSAIMGPLSFHANWSEKAELRGCQHMQKENL